MASSPERRKIENVSVSDTTKPHVERHYVHGEKIDMVTTPEEKIEILRKIFSYERRLLTAIEQNPSLTPEARGSVVPKQMKIIREAKANLEEARNQKPA
ncbi:MAG: hypothetical protein Q8L52_02450 [bacterium]|nr:hypothetical protein [bacterium]